MAPEQLEDVLDCQGPVENQQALLEHFITRAANARAEAKRCDETARQRAIEADDWRLRASGFDALVEALKGSVVNG